MKKYMLLPAQVGVALVVILVWHLFTATTPVSYTHLTLPTTPYV